MKIDNNAYAGNIAEIKETVCDYLKLKNVKILSSNPIDVIKELCVMRLCNAVGISGTYNFKSDFFNFFGSIMGEAVCQVLNIKLHVAGEELRLIKYEHINLIEEAKSYLDRETIEEAFLDAFELVDRFKYLIKQLKKV